MKTNLTIDIWDFVDIEKINAELDKVFKSKYKLSSIGYRCLRVTFDGRLTLEAEFERTKI